jgi:hypothetical protein
MGTSLLRTFGSPAPDHWIAAGDFGSLAVRRPGPVKHIQTWRFEKLGDSPLAEL